VKILEAADLIFTLDFNALHRVGGGMEEVLSEMKAPFIMIDHHQKTDDYAAYSYSDTSIGSTCEMLYNFISFLGKKISTKQNYWNLYLYRNSYRSGSFSFQEPQEIRTGLFPN
jgi:phosphoesterase RecJ-like protein